MDRADGGNGTSLRGAVLNGAPSSGAPASGVSAFDGENSSDVAVTRSVFAGALFLLTCFGVIAVHTSSVTTRQEGFEPIYLTRHVSHLAIAFGVMLWAGSRDWRFWKRSAWWAALFVGGALVLVLIPGVGISGGGATRWIRIPGFSVQPSEWAKVAVPLLLAAWLCGRESIDGVWKRRAGDALCGIVVAMFVLLVLAQPDLGTALLVLAAACFTMWFAGTRLRWFVSAVLLLVPIAATVSLKGYQLRRISGLIDTWRDWHDAPYQLRQSLIALGEGGFSGVGLGRGWQKLSFLPESHTDFVIAVVGEEMGLVGIGVVGCLWIVLLSSGMSLAARCDDLFGQIVASTLLTMVVLQAALNVAVAAAVIPPTGIPHPLLSYGGNSLLATSMALGVFWSVTSPNTNVVAADLASTDSIAEPLISEVAA